MVKAKKWIYAKHFQGHPNETNFRLEEEELPELKDGEVLVEAEFLSVDPYMRAYVRKLKEGQVMIGSYVGRVIESKSPKLAVGQHVVSWDGWRSHTIVNPDSSSNALFQVLTDFESLPKSLGLGVIGMPGATAYFGFLRICKPKAGETVVVNAAAGAVGSLVGQIAKIKGCRVIGYAGSDAKCKWIKEELGFDHAFNYKTTNLEQTLKEAAPNGVDCYFDNVGGIFSVTVMNHMNEFGRVSICGCISNYIAEKPDEGPYLFGTMLFKQLKVEGFVVTRWTSQWDEAIKQMLEWVKEGKLKYRETITDGFENMPKALIGLFTGDNTGKAVVRV